MARISLIKLPRQSLSEEIANSVTHGIGLGLALAGLCVLVAQAALHGDAWHIISCSIYGATLVILYAASTIYHSCQVPEIKKWCRLIDHSAIYLLIAGTFTPFGMVVLRQGTGWILLGILWGLSFFGILYKLFFLGRYEKLSTAIYLAMGWLPVLATMELIDLLPMEALILIGAGGLAYTGGIVFFLLDHKRFFHTIWHVCVLKGSICHYIAVLLYVIP